jgi:TniQ
VAVAYAPDGAASPRLLAAPEPLRGESRGSWVQRLCGAHQYSMPRLHDITGIRPCLWDWDRAIPRSQWHALLAMANLAADSCAEAIQGLGILTNVFKGPSFFLHLAGKPQYRWCSQCMATDPVPYLRWEWRLKKLTHCTVHGTLLEDHCPWCGSGLHTHRALLVSVGRSVGVPDLATCAACGMALHDVNDTSPKNDPKSDASDDLLNALLVRLKQPESLVDAQLELDFYRYAEALDVKISASNKASTVTKEDLIRIWEGVNFGLIQLIGRFGRVRDPQSFPLRIDGHTFQHDHAEANPANFRLRKWSRLLQPGIRGRLAAVLRTIRRERQLQRVASSGIPPAEEKPAADQDEP